MSGLLGPGTRLVVATHNAGKLAEFRDLLGPYGIDLVSAGELGLPEPAETGTLYAENAAIKARAATDATGLPAIADDSGLAVEALDGAPGLFTRPTGRARPRDFAAAMARVDRGKAAPSPGRHHRRRSGRRFVAVLCARPGPTAPCCIFEGRVFGTLVWPPRGDQGLRLRPDVPAGRPRPSPSAR
jgi:XTP/dITP diphosphohydrolase